MKRSGKSKTKASVLTAVARISSDPKYNKRVSSTGTGSAPAVPTKLTKVHARGATVREDVKKEKTTTIRVVRQPSNLVHRPEKKEAPILHSIPVPSEVDTHDDSFELPSPANPAAHTVADALQFAKKWNRMVWSREEEDRLPSISEKKRENVNTDSSTQTCQSSEASCQAVAEMVIASTQTEDIQITEKSGMKDDLLNISDMSAFAPDEVAALHKSLQERENRLKQRELDLQREQAQLQQRWLEQYRHLLETSPVKKREFELTVKEPVDSVVKGVFEADVNGVGMKERYEEEEEAILEASDEVEQISNTLKQSEMSDINRRSVEVFLPEEEEEEGENMDNVEEKKLARKIESELKPEKESSTRIEERNVTIDDNVANSATWDQLAELERQLEEQHRRLVAKGYIPRGKESAVRSSFEQRETDNWEDIARQLSEMDAEDVVKRVLANESLVSEGLESSVSDVSFSLSPSTAGGRTPGM